MTSNLLVVVELGRYQEVGAGGFRETQERDKLREEDDIFELDKKVQEK